MTFTLKSIGDPMSELNIRRRIEFLRSILPPGVSYVPESWVKSDPALQWGVENLDWLKTEKPPE